MENRKNLDTPNHGNNFIKQRIRTSMKSSYSTVPTPDQHKSKQKINPYREHRYKFKQKDYTCLLKSPRCAPNRSQINDGRAALGERGGGVPPEELRGKRKSFPRSKCGIEAERSPSRCTCRGTCRNPWRRIS